MNRRYHWGAWGSRSEKSNYTQEIIMTLICIFIIFTFITIWCAEEDPWRMLFWWFHWFSSVLATEKRFPLYFHFLLCFLLVNFKLIYPISYRPCKGMFLHLRSFKLFVQQLCYHSETSWSIKAKEQGKREKEVVSSLSWFD